MKGKHQLSAGMVLFPPKLTPVWLEPKQGYFWGFSYWTLWKWWFFNIRKREELFVFLWWNVPSGIGATLFFGEQHLQRCLSPTEGTLKLEMREPTTFSCSCITLGMGWDRLALPALAEQGHCVTLCCSRWVWHQQTTRRSSQSMRMNGSANETWRR